MKRGGSRKGKPNKLRKTDKELLQRAIDAVAKKNGGYESLLGSLWESASGILVQETDRKGEVHIYTKPPDTFAAKTLLEFRFGRAPQPVTGEDGGPIKVNIVQDVPVDD